jgi:putative oxidoreductase
VKIPFLIGRIAFGGFFLYNGINHLRKRAEIKQHVASKNVPMPDAAVTVSGLALMFGSASILLGLKPKYGVAALAAFLAIVSPVMHDFWNAPPERQMNEMIHFMKNMALLGAALQMLGLEEPWPASIPLGEPGYLERAMRFAKLLAA